MKQIKILIMTLLFVSIATSGWAAWWIFGASKDEVSISYMHLNDISFDELGEKVTVYKDTMQNGEALIKGKATAGKNKIALVEVTTDGQATWKPADLNENGTFNFRFTPETGKTYKIAVKVSDTTGKNNNVATTVREVSISTENIRALIQKALSNLIAAYQSRNSTAFMANVSDKFAGDATNLDRAIRRDFSLFDNITLSYTINNITSSGGRVAVSISYNRSVFATRNSANYRDQGITDFTFSIEAGEAKVSSMKNPLIFGLSDAANVATGNSANDPNALVLAVDASGTVSSVAFKNINSENAGTPAVYAGTYRGGCSGGNIVSSSMLLAIDRDGNICGIADSSTSSGGSTSSLQSDAFSGAVDANGRFTITSEHNRTVTRGTITPSGLMTGIGIGEGGGSFILTATRYSSSVDTSVCRKTGGYFKGKYNGTCNPGNVAVSMTVDNSGAWTGTSRTATATYNGRGRVDAAGNVIGTFDAYAPDGVNGMIVTGNAPMEGDWIINITATGRVSGQTCSGQVLHD